MIPDHAVITDEVRIMLFPPPPKQNLPLGAKTVHCSRVVEIHPASEFRVDEQ